MTDSGETRRLRAGDTLYRKVNAGQYDGQTIDPAAFFDKYPRQSFYLARAVSPAQALASFARFSGVKRQCGTGDREPTPSEMYAAGYRIAEVPYQAFIDLKCRVDVDDAGNEFAPNGHVNIVDAKSYATPLSRCARLLSREETLAGRSCGDNPRRSRVLLRLPD
jgi:hypothetical protein